MAKGFTVEDLGSKNGTLVNDIPKSVHTLRHDDRVLIGATLITYHDQAQQTRSEVVIAEEDGRTSQTTRYVSKDRELLLPQRRLQMNHDLSQRLTTLQGRDELLQGALKICFDMLHFERGAIGVRPSRGKGLEWPLVQNLRGTGGELRISRTLLNRALEHGERAIFTEDDAGATDPTVSMVQQGIRSAMCVPLTHDDEILGVVYGDRTSTSTRYTEEDIDFFAGIAKQVSIGLINCRLVEEQKAMVQLRHEIELARKIQTGLFPVRLPHRAKLKVAATNEPGNRVSGDYYDVLEAADGRCWCLIADVTGEGIAAALLMANLQAAVHMSIDGAADPGALLTQWNRLIFQNTDASKFITCSLALIDPTSRVLYVSSAGHGAPIILRHDGSQPTELELEAGFPLGVVQEGTYRTHAFDFPDTPFFFFTFTDGVTEAMNRAQDQFGTPRLMACLTDAAKLNPNALLKHVRRSITQFVDGAPQSDDLTMLAASVTP